MVATLRAQTGVLPGGGVVALTLALGFALASVQAVLDLQGTYRSWDLSLLRPLLLGAVVGLLGGALLALALTFAVRALGGELALAQAWAALGRSFRPAIAYGIVGLGLNGFLKWNTAIACALVGLLWALPLLAGELRPHCSGSLGRSAALATPAVLGLIAIWARYGWL